MMNSTVMSKSALTAALSESCEVNRGVISTALSTLASIATTEAKKKTDKFVISGVAMIKNGQKKATNAGQREILGKVVMVKAKPAKTLLMALRLSFLPIFVNLFRIVSHRAFGDKLLRTAYSFPVFYPHAFSNKLLRHALRALHQGGPPHRGVPPPSEIERPLADQQTPSSFALLLVILHSPATPTSRAFKSSLVMTMGGLKLNLTTAPLALLKNEEKYYRRLAPRPPAEVPKQWTWDPHVGAGASAVWGGVVRAPLNADEGTETI